MGAIIIWSFIAYGLTTILVYGSIFEKPRTWISNKSKFLGKLINCVLCTSTWVGFFMSVFLGSITANYVVSLYIINIFFDGMFTAGIVWAINAIIEFFEENRIK